MSYTYRFPVREGIDYRMPEHRMELALAWAEANAVSGEHNQQLRLMNWALEKQAPLKGYDVVEAKLWLSFLWGACYNLITPWVMVQRYPRPPRTPEEFEEFSGWYNRTFERHKFDTDCRYRKSKMLQCVKSYVDSLNGCTQYEKFTQLVNDNQDPKKMFDAFWGWSESIEFFGRLSCWNHLEALALVTGWEHPLDAPNYFLTELSDSESNRNGICFLFNVEHLLTKHGKLKTTGETISVEDCLMLEGLAEQATQRVISELGDITCFNRFNLETVIACWFKKMFRNKSTRYIGWDAERTFEEIKYVEQLWPEYSTDLLWEARRELVPHSILCELNGVPVGGVQEWKDGDFFRTGVPESILCLQNGVRWKPKKFVEPKKAKQIKTVSTAKRLF